MPADPQRDGHRIAAIASILVPMLILTGGLVLSDHVSFNRWDNAEAYVAQLWHTHQRILDADLPYWNQHQDMGRPVLARSTHGVFYPGYTISVWVADVAGLGQTGNLAVITLLHAGFAGLAVFCFAHELGARPVFALMASIGVVLSGNIQYVGSVWVFVLPYMGWSVWSLWGLRRLIDMDRPAAGFVGASLSLAVLFHMGHVEWAFKCWLMSAFFAIGYGLVRKNLHRRVGYLVALAVAAALLAMPTLLPVMELAEQSRRNKPFSAEVFSAGGVSPESLIGLLLPVLGGNDGFFVRETVLCSLYFGAWVLPAILLWMFYRRTPSKSVGPAIALLTAMGIVIIWLSTGEDGLLHPLTRWIPVWSRFRWPFKIYERAIPLLVIAGALSIELMAARKFSACRCTCLVSIAVVSLLLWIVRPAPITVGAVAAGAGALGVVVCLSWIHRPAVQFVSLLLLIVSHTGLMLVCHHPKRYMSYKTEFNRILNAGDFGIDTAYRVLPISLPAVRGRHMQELGLFESATLNGLYSATGSDHALMYRRLRRYMPVMVEGVPPREHLGTRLNMNLLRSFNIKYIIAAKTDNEAIEILSSTPGYHKHNETENALIYANDNALPRAYFATGIHGLEHNALVSGMGANNAPVTAAFVENAATTGVIGVGSVKAIDWGHDGVRIDVDAPDGGYLVISMNNDPNWRATVDGKPARLRLTNGAITGLYVPAGASKIELAYVSDELHAGLWFAAGGLVVFVLTPVALRRRADAR